MEFVEYLKVVCLVLKTLYYLGRVNETRYLSKFELMGAIYDTLLKFRNVIK